MKTYRIEGYTAWGTGEYIVDVIYRGERLASFSGPSAGLCALYYVSRNAGRAIINMGDK